MDLAQLKAETQERITRAIAAAVPDVTESMLKLALGAEKEDVRFRAGKWALEEFSDRNKKLQSLPQTNVQIINAIPFERTAYIGKKEAETVQIGNVTVALPKVLREITPEPPVASTRSSFGGLTKLDSEAMGGHSPESSMYRQRTPDYVPPPESTLARQLTESSKGGKTITPPNQSIPPKRNY